jgi:hypothetical protein
METAEHYETATNGTLSERDELLATLVATGSTIKAAGDELQLSYRQACRPDSYRSDGSGPWITCTIRQERGREACSVDGV